MKVKSLVAIATRDLSWNQEFIAEPHDNDEGKSLGGISVRWKQAPPAS